jgi:UDP-galactopyranose mutase
VAYHRILVRKNFSIGSHGYWIETNTKRFETPPDDRNLYIDTFAYPLNTTEKPSAMKNLLEFARYHEIFGLGRWGEHEHYNSDIVVDRAMELADILLDT